VRYGPWLGTFTETESCTEGELNRWVFAIPDWPEVGTVWYGGLEDMPAMPSISIVWGTETSTKTTTECCDGYFWCGYSNECLKVGEECGPKQPA
jgi:hypothetical protein